MNNLQCEICGSNNFTVVDSVPTCQSCGTKYPKLKKEEISLDEKLREEEILRLTKPPEKILGIFESSRVKEPQPGILTDDEILKYAPRSKAAKSIKFKRKGGWSAYFKCYKLMYMILLIFLLIWSIMMLTVPLDPKAYLRNVFLSLYCVSMLGFFVLTLIGIPVSIHVFKR
jgi:hypothetical protein